MDECCKKYFGEFPHNKNIVLTGLFATYDGPYTVRVDLPSGNKQEFEITGVNGDELTIPKMVLNENMLHKFQVFDQWGEPVIYTDDYSITCDKFSLKTYINQSLICDDNSCDSSENNSSEPYGYS